MYLKCYLYAHLCTKYVNAMQWNFSNLIEVSANVCVCLLFAGIYSYPCAVYISLVRLYACAHTHAHITSKRTLAHTRSDLVVHESLVNPFAE